MNPARPATAAAPAIGATPPADATPFCTCPAVSAPACAIFMPVAMFCIFFACALARPSSYG